MEKESKKIIFEEIQRLVELASDLEQARIAGRDAAAILNEVHVKIYNELQK